MAIMRGRFKLVGMAIAFLLGGWLIVMHVILPSRISQAFEAELASLREHADITFDTVDVTTDGVARLHDVVLRLKTKPIEARIKRIDVEARADKVTRLTLIQPTFLHDGKPELEAEEIGIAALDPEAIGSFLDGNGSMIPAKPLSGINAKDIMVHRRDAHFTAKRLIVGTATAESAENIEIEMASWRWTDETGEHAMQAERVRLANLNHAYLARIDDAFTENQDGLAVTAPNGLIRALVADSVIVENAFGVAGRAYAETLSIADVEDAALIDMDIDSARGEFGDYGYSFDKISLDRLPLWLTDGWARFEFDCMASDACRADPLTTAGHHLLDRIEASGGLTIQGYSFVGGTITPKDPSGLTMRDLTIAFRDFRIALSQHGEPYLDNAVFEFTGRGPINGLGPRERSFLGPTGIEGDISFATRVAMSTDPTTGRAEGAWEASIKDLGSIGADLAMADIAPDALNLRLASPGLSPLTYLLTTDGGLDAATFTFDDDGLMDLYLDRSAAQFGQGRDAVVAVLKQQLQGYGLIFGPSLNAVIPELERFLDAPQSLTIRIDPESPIPLQAFSTLWATQPQGFLQRMNVSVEANR